MLRKIIFLGVFLLTVSTIGGHFLGQSKNFSVKKPTFKCTDDGDYNCLFTNVTLSEDEPEWDPVPAFGVIWLKVQFETSNIPVFTNDICRVFPTITWLDMYSTNIKEIRENAFEGCYYLRILNLRENHITKLDIDTFSFLPHLNTLHLGFNNLTSFPMELIRNNAEFFDIDLRSNELSDIDEKKMLKYIAKLVYFGFNDNEISCVRVAEIYKNLKAKGIEFYLGIGGIVKQRYYQTMMVYGHICLSDVEYAATLYRKNTDAKSGAPMIGLEGNFKEKNDERLETIETKLGTILEWIEIQK